MFPKPCKCVYCEGKIPNWSSFFEICTLEKANKPLATYTLDTKQMSNMNLMEIILFIVKMLNKCLLNWNQFNSSEFHINFVGKNDLSFHIVISWIKCSTNESNEMVDKSSKIM